MFHPKLMGVVGTCASMIIGEDLKEAIENVDLDCIIIPVEVHAGLGEGDNTEGAILVLERAVEYGVIPKEEADRQIKIELTDKARTYLIDNGYDAVYGARPLKRFVQKKLETLIARKILEQVIVPKSEVVVDFDGNELIIK